jgi:hypothetical protein
MSARLSTADIPAVGTKVPFGSRAIIRQGCWYQFRQHARQRRAGSQQRAAEARGGGAGAATAPTMACPTACTVTCSTRTVWQWCSPLPWRGARASAAPTIARQRFAPAAQLVGHRGLLFRRTSLQGSFALGALDPFGRTKPALPRRRAWR